MSNTRRIRLYDGRLVDPFMLQPEDVVDEVFLHSISLINRYTGATLYPYSVGQHSLILANHVPEHLVRAAFIHDWAEALFNDIASPVKHQFQNYIDAEEEALQVIFEAKGVDWSLMEELSPFDKRIYKDEREVLFKDIHSATAGMNDRRVPLGIDSHFFRERAWRDVREDLFKLNRELF
jgi:hypothetical protein